MSLSRRRFLMASALSLLMAGVLSAVMVPVRGHLSVATTGLVLVIPVVSGVAIGGFAAGVVSVTVGFLAYDLLFIPPYGTLAVGPAQDWVALVVYVAVMLLVARIVSALSAARREGRRQEEHLRRLFELSEYLVHEHGTEELEEQVVTAVHEVFAMPSVVLLRVDGDDLEPVAFAGEPWGADELALLVPRRHVPVSAATQGGGIRGVALSATGTPVGLIGLKGPSLRPEERDLLRFFTTHAALSLERARLREQAVRSEILEETERVQKSLMGAVSHDLRTPLATIKLSASALQGSGLAMEETDRAELLRTIDAEADRLSRLVTNLLDMTRVQAGALTVDAQPVSVADLVREATAPLAPVLADHPLSLEVGEGLPLVAVDPILVVQALANLVENAARHCPAGTAVHVHAEHDGTDTVVVTVEDDGPGLGPHGPDEVFLPFRGSGPGRGTGVGLSIAKAFVEAHGQRIWAEEPQSGGARFRFTLPIMAGAGGRC